MDIEKSIRLFIENKVINKESVNELLENDISSMYSLNRVIKTAFEELNNTIKKINDETFSFLLGKINKYIDLIYYLCNDKAFTEKEILYNRERINKVTESLKELNKKYNNQILRNCSDKLNNIILDKNICLEELKGVIIALIDKNENLNIIKKFIAEYRNISSLDKSNLFDYAFKKTLNSLDNNNENIYYNITLLRILYHSHIPASRYLYDLLAYKDNPYYTELVSLVKGNKFSLEPEQILNKYRVLPKLEISDFKIINTNKPDGTIFTIDGDKTLLRDDGVSIKKEGNNYLIGIHIADAGKHIEIGSDIDNIAKKNFRCIYGYGNTRLLPSDYEKALSLNAFLNKDAISLYVLMNDGGDILDYYVKNHTIFVGKNLTYMQADNMINNPASKNQLKRSLEELFSLSQALEEKDKKKMEYWQKKEQSSSENFKNLEFKSDMIIRELSGLYNSLLGEYTHENNIPYIYRVQDEEYISKLIKESGLSNYSFIRNITKNIYLDSKYSSTPKHHSGLGIKTYTKSSNPLRDYPSLYTQFLLHKFVFKDKDFRFSDEEFLMLIDYFNRRDSELKLMKDEYKRAVRYR